MNIEQIILEKKGTLIDVRESFELETEGSVPDAVNIPLGEIEYNIEEIRNFKKPLIIFCRSGNRSSQAIDILENEGLTELYNGMGFRDILETLGL